MRTRQIAAGAILLGVCTLSACSTGGTPDVPRLTAPPTVTATIITSPQNGGCDAAIEGDCWLPLYPTIGSMTGVPLNASTEPGATCEMVIKDSDNDTTKAAKEKGCWPQPATAGKPGDTVTLTCAQIVGNELWIGVQMPPDKVLSLKATTPRTGYNRAQYVNAAGIDSLNTCTK
ncbi:MAG TPA: hypothetical protein VLG40_04555 [Candidatus Saccharimonas sp.]|nr:hypothetical protein [Candidatus Saccharimonas sp.]